MNASSPTIHSSTRNAKSSGHRMIHSQVNARRQQRGPLAVIASLFVVGIILATASSCAYDSRADERDVEKDQWVYLWLTTERNDSRNACLDSQREAFACINRAYGAPVGQEIYIQGLEQAYTITVTPPRDEASLCHELVYSDKFPDPTNDGSVTYSQGAKNCIFDCQREFWRRQQVDGLCTAQTYNPQNAVNDERLAGCMEVCFKRGTILYP